MRRSLKNDLAKMRGFAFRRLERCGALLKAFHAQRKKINRRDDADLIWNLYDWLTAPLSLWPIDFEGLAQHTLALVKSGRRSDDQLLLLLRLVGFPPSESAQQVVGTYEHDVAHGRYEKLVRQQEKFIELEKQLAADTELQSVWQEIKRHFRPGRLGNARGVIRRRMSQERNFREGWGFDWRSPRKRFLLIFDALCYRWDLYGFEKDQPLLLKVSVNPTPYGTMIVIPRHWSFDQRRDLNWKQIGKLHRAHGATRQGPKMSPSRVERRAEAAATKQAWDEVTRQGKRGEARYTAVLQRLGKDLRTDPSCIKRLLRLARN